MGCDCVGDCVGEGVTRGIDLLCEVASCVIHYDELVKNLENESGESEEGILYAKLVDVKKAVQKDEANGQEIKNEVESWIKNSENTRKTAKALLEKIERSTCCLCMGFNMNCLFRYVNAKEAKRIGEEIKARITEGSLATQGGVSTKPSRLPYTLPEDYVELGSGRAYLETLRGWLVDEEKLAIGLHGQEGAGKTMLVQVLAYEIQKGVQYFKYVAIIDWRADLFKIQERIGERVAFTSLRSVQDLEERRLSIHNRLSTATEKVLIIIDQVDERQVDTLNTYLIGIPRPATTSNFRIMIVSRDLDVCHRVMKTEMNLEVEPLSQAESSNLYKQLAINSHLTPSPLKSEVDAIHRIESRDGPWLPGQLKAYVSALHKLIVQINQSPSWNLMLPAVACHIEHSQKVKRWKWLISMEAEIQNVWYLYIWGWAKKEWLCQKTNYGAYFVYKFNPGAKGFDGSDVEFTIVIEEKNVAGPTLCHLGPPEAASRDDGWMEIEMGRFYNKGNSSIRLEVREFRDQVKKIGLVFRGIELRRLDKLS